MFYIEVWFTENPDDRTQININLVINSSVEYKNDLLFSSTKRLNICKMLGIFAIC